ncbi:hypothetical protein H1C71_038041 [Ictidomys tridecemlineatus]|nr:hypothetical protein H1C71_038041 [Ictidomys tridecemlineatus]
MSKLCSLCYLNWCIVEKYPKFPQEGCSCKWSMQVCGEGVLPVVPGSAGPGKVVKSRSTGSCGPSHTGEGQRRKILTPYPRSDYLVPNPCGRIHSAFSVLGVDYIWQNFLLLSREKLGEANKQNCSLSIVSP